MPEETDKCQEMHPSGTVIQHFPFIQTERKHHDGRKPSKPGLMFSAIFTDDHGRSTKTQNSKHTVKCHTVIKQADIDHTAQITDRHSGQQIRYIELLRIPNIRQIVIDQTDVIGIDHVDGRNIYII